MSGSVPLRVWLIAFVACAATVLVCIAFVDRPVVDFVEAHWRHTAFADGVNRAFGGLVVVVPVVFVCLLAAGGAAIAGRSLPSWMSVPVACSLSAVCALAMTVAFKRFFGRSAADPHYLGQHIYSFQLLRGVRGYDSFPSGTTGIGAAIVAVLCLRMPRLRAAWLTILVAAALALVITNNHWVSDIVAGGFLGASIGWVTVLLAARTARDRAGVAP